MCVYACIVAKNLNGSSLFLVCFTTEVIYFVPWALDLPTERETSPADEVTDLENFSWLAYLQF